MNAPGGAIGPRRQGDDIARLKAHAPAIATDVALGLLFFVMGKFTDLRTAALATAGVGLALLPVQWAINRWSPLKLDLLGGMALFGIVMMLLSAGFSWHFDSELAVQLKATVIGAIGAACFGLDALFGRGRWLGERMKTYLVYDDVDARRLAAGMGAAGACMAGINLAVAWLMSKDAWLWYTLWGDLLLVLVLAQLAIQWSRRGARAPAAVR
jgi:intracellular septation protein A